MVEQRIEALLKRRQQLVRQHTIELQHLESASDTESVRSIKRTLKYLAAEINSIETKINSDIDNDEGLKQRLTHLLAVKGIGKISAYALIALLPELGKVSNKEIAALVGVAPQQRER